jgi:hypothetical protein
VEAPFDADPRSDEHESNTTYTSSYHTRKDSEKPQQPQKEQVFLQPMGLTINLMVCVYASVTGVRMQNTVNIASGSSNDHLIAQITSGTDIAVL